MRRTLNGLALLVLAAAGVGLVYASSRDTQGASQSGRIAVRNVTLFDGTSRVEHATVVFDESGIVSICAACPAPTGARVIDGTGNTLLPGLIDAHTHTWGDALERALVFGVTTEIDMFTAPSFAAVHRAEQNKGTAFERADLISAGYLLTVAGGHGTEYGMQVPTFAKGMDPQRFIDDRLAEGSDFIKLVYDNGAAFKLRFASLDAADLAALIAATRKRGKLAVVHVSSSGSARDAVLAGAHGLVHSWGDDEADDKLFAEIARRGVFVIPTLSVLGSVAGRTESIPVAEHASLAKYVNAAELAGLRAKFPDTSHQPNALENAKRVVRRLWDHNVTLLAGTDAPNPGTAHGISIHRELQLLVETGLTPLEALRAATSIPAHTFRLSDRGTVKPGQRADLLLVAGDATADIRATQKVLNVWKSGRELQRGEGKSTEAAERAAITRGMISDFEMGLGSAFGTSWMVSTDQMMGGKSIGALALAAASGIDGATQVLRVEGSIVPGQLYPWSGAMLLFATRPMAPVDLRPAREILFRIRSAAPLRLMVFATSRGQIPVARELPAASDWTTVIVSFAELGLDGSDIQGMLISGTTANFSYELDEVMLR